MNYGKVRGFNYQPSWGSTGFDIWHHFDRDVLGLELDRGKRYFPGMNALRLWLSYDAWVACPERVAADFETALALSADRGLVTMPVLFNRWHSGLPDYGGTYVDHFVPALSRGRSESWFIPYLDAIVGEHAGDPRVFCWDLCNEPFYYAVPAAEIPEIATAEFGWLSAIYERCKALGAGAPLTVGMIMSLGVSELQRVEPLSDILSFHPYWIPPSSKASFEGQLDAFAGFASAKGKPLLATETCWGALDDGERTANVRYTLCELKKRDIGWLAYVLHHSQVADAHRADYGPLGSPGNLAFIEADGSLRAGHNVFNEF
jgi:hypothetical protein